MDVKEMALRYLQENGFDGLGNGDIECGCTIKDFMPCGGDSVTECTACYAWKVKAFNKANEGNSLAIHEDEADFVMSEEKPAVLQRFKI